MLSSSKNRLQDPCPDSFNMAAYVLEQAQHIPEKTALRILDTHAQEWSYAKLDQTVRSLATGFLNKGLKPKDKVLIRLGNRVEYPLAYLAAIAVDLIPVPTSPQLTIAETSKIISELSPALILSESDVPCPEHSCKLSLPGLQTMFELPAAEFVCGPPDRPAYIVYTSGTSGTPRAVLHAHRAVWARRMMHNGWVGLQKSDRMLHAGAFNWTYTMGIGLIDPWTVGATALIPSPNTPTRALLGLIHEHDATIFAAAPGVYRQMLKTTSSLNASSLRHGLSAGEKLSDAVAQSWNKATGTVLHEAYGLSECSTFISASPDHPALPGTSGRPQPGRCVAILNEHGEPVPPNTPGTIAVHNSDPGLMLGYENAPKETAARFHGDWFVTGDQAHMDEDGNITYLGRADDMMNAGGFRVSPLEVEAALSSAPGIGTIAVTDIEVKPDVHIVVAFYTSDAALDGNDLKEFAEDRLAAYKTPRAYIHVAKLPTGANGKLLRKALKQLWRPDDQA